MSQHSKLVVSGNQTRNPKEWAARSTNFNMCSQSEIKEENSIWTYFKGTAMQWRGKRHKWQPKLYQNKRLNLDVKTQM